MSYPSLLGERKNLEGATIKKAFKIVAPDNRAVVAVFDEFAAKKLAAIEGATVVSCFVLHDSRSSVNAVAEVSQITVLEADDIEKSLMLHREKILEKLSPEERLILGLKN